MYTLTIEKGRGKTEQHSFKTSQATHKYISTHWNDRWDYWITTPNSVISFEVRDFPMF